MDITALLRVLFQFYCLMLAGFLLAKWNVLDHETNRKMSTLVVSATYPATLLCSMQTAPMDNRSAALWLTAGSFLMFTVLTVAAKALAAALRVPRDRRAGFVCLLFPIPVYYGDLAILSLAMPAGSLVLMLALQLKLDDQFITRSIFVSTLLSAASMPAVAALFLR